MAVPLIVYGAMAGLQLLSGVQQANNIQKQAELSKELDEFNREQSLLDAFNAERDGYTQMARYGSTINAIESTQRNIYYANDVNPGFGTAADIQADTKNVGQLNLLDIQSQAHQRALGYKKQALGIKTQSGMNQIGASLQSTSARNTAILGAANTMITGYERNGGLGKAGPKNVKRGYDPTMISEEDYNIQYGGGLGSYP
jgi:hypothetical protein